MKILKIEIQSRVGPDEDWQVLVTARTDEGKLVTVNGLGSSYKGAIASATRKLVEGAA